MVGKIHFDNINLRNEYSLSKAYSQSKLANILFTRELARRLGKKSNINAYSLHPGAVKTDFMRNIKPNVFLSFVVGILKLMFIDVYLGSQTTLHCALEESLDNETGYYYE
jgi:NAD(P)-dependent dehydrogenase (short-subunit alcohol dehydrogenase family)